MLAQHCLDGLERVVNVVVHFLAMWDRLQQAGHPLHDGELGHWARDFGKDMCRISCGAGKRRAIKKCCITRRGAYLPRQVKSSIHGRTEVATRLQLFHWLYEYTI